MKRLSIYLLIYVLFIAVFSFAVPLWRNLDMLIFGLIDRNTPEISDKIVLINIPYIYDIKNFRKRTGI